MGTHEPRPYRKTIFDRLGPDAGLVVHAALWTMVLTVPGGFLGFYLATRVGAGWLGALVLIVGIGVAAWAIGAGVVLWWTGKVGQAWLGFTMPSGNSTPYQEQFSQEDALVMRGEVAIALEAYEQRIALDPTGIRVRLKAAELYATLGKNPVRAAELFREVQRMPGLTPGDDQHASNRLADLYLGPLQDPGRALVTLRRLVELYPRHHTTPRVREAIARLKAHAGAATDRQS
jgi:hypothetical protein